MSTLFGSVNDDSLTGTAEDDTLHGGPAANPASDVGQDTLLGGDGNDLLLGYGGFDLLFGGDGDDTAQGGTGNDRISDNDDLPTGVADNDLLAGQEGDDELSSTGGFDTLDGGADFDRVVIDRSLSTAALALTFGTGTTIDLGDGTRLIDCELYTALLGTGNDRLDAALSLSANGGAGDDTLTAVTASGVTQFSGDDGNDLIDASTLPAAARLVGVGGEGNDTILGGAGNDTIANGMGADSIVAGAGNDEIRLAATATPMATIVDAGVGADLIEIQPTSSVVVHGTAHFDGGPNADRLVLPGLVIYLPNTTPFANIETLLLTPGAILYGTVGADLLDFAAIGVISGGVASGLRLLADAGADSVTGSTGDDLIAGGAGRASLAGGGGGGDILLGEAGADTLAGGAGDELHGGKGNDLYLVTGLGANVFELAGSGRDTVQASLSFDLPDEVECLVLAGAGALDGGGNGLANAITGNDGANHLFGLAGDDSLKGGRGDDTLEGGSGRDKLNGGRGADLLWGGADRDLFVFAGPAEGGGTLGDFTQGEDRIQVSAAGFGGGLAAGMDLRVAGRFVTGTVATAEDGQFLFDPATLRLLWDADGSAAGGAVLLLTANTPLAARDIAVIA